MRTLAKSILLLAALAALAFFWLVPMVMRARADNPVWKGMREAQEHGCFNCHDAPHNVELQNPASPFGTVPSFAGGNLMMYVDRIDEVEEWIRNGYTKKRREDKEAWAKYQAQLIRMPAFGSRLDEDEIRALGAFVLAADSYLTPPDPIAQRGEEVARAQCQSCHNVGGAGGLANPGAPFGYIPAWWGPDFHDLVKNEDELREWISTGTSARVAKLPLAAWFWRRQVLSMPAFAERIPPADVDALVAYIHWLGKTAGGTKEESAK